MSLLHVDFLAPPSCASKSQERPPLLLWLRVVTVSDVVQRREADLAAAASRLQRWWRRVRQRCQPLPVVGRVHSRGGALHRRAFARDRSDNTVAVASRPPQRQRPRSAVPRVSAARRPPRAEKRALESSQLGEGVGRRQGKQRASSARHCALATAERRHWRAVTRGADQLPTAASTHFAHVSARSLYAASGLEASGAVRGRVRPRTGGSSRDQSGSSTSRRIRPVSASVLRRPGAGKGSPEAQLPHVGSQAASSTHGHLRGGWPPMRLSLALGRVLPAQRARAVGEDLLLVPLPVAAAGEGGDVKGRGGEREEAAVPSTVPQPPSATSLAVSLPMSPRIEHRSAGMPSTRRCARPRSAAATLRRPRSWWHLGAAHSAAAQSPEATAQSSGPSTARPAREADTGSELGPSRWSPHGFIRPSSLPLEESLARSRRERAAMEQAARAVAPDGRGGDDAGGRLRAQSASMGTPLRRAPWRPLDLSSLSSAARAPSLDDARQKAEEVLHGSAQGAALAREEETHVRASRTVYRTLAQARSASPPCPVPVHTPAGGAEEEEGSAGLVTPPRSDCASAPRSPRDGAEPPVQPLPLHCEGRDDPGRWELGGHTRGGADEGPSPQLVLPGTESTVPDAWSYRWTNLGAVLEEGEGEAVAPSLAADALAGRLGTRLAAAASRGWFRPAAPCGEGEGPASEVSADALVRRWTRRGPPVHVLPVAGAPPVKYAVAGQQVRVVLHRTDAARRGSRQERGLCLGVVAPSGASGRWRPSSAHSQASGATAPIPGFFGPVSAHGGLTAAGERLAREPQPQAALGGASGTAPALERGAACWGEFCGWNGDPTARVLVARRADRGEPGATALLTLQPYGGRASTHVPRRRLLLATAENEYLRVYHGWALPAVPADAALPQLALFANVVDAVCRRRRLLAEARGEGRPAEASTGVAGDAWPELRGLREPDGRALAAVFADTPSTACADSAPVCGDCAALLDLLDRERRRAAPRASLRHASLSTEGARRRALGGPRAALASMRSTRALPDLARRPSAASTVASREGKREQRGQGKKQQRARRAKPQQELQRRQRRPRSPLLEEPSPAAMLGPADLPQLPGWMPPY